MLLASKDFRNYRKKETVRESKTIDIIFDFLLSRGVDFENFNDQQLHKVMNALNERNGILWINDHSTLRPIFVNEYGREYYGFSSTDLTTAGFELYEQFMHPDHFDDVHNTIAFFTKHPRNIHRMTYRIRNKDGHCPIKTIGKCLINYQEGKMK